MTRNELVGEICDVIARAHGGSYSRALRVVERLERLGLVVLPTVTPDQRQGHPLRDAMAEAIDAGVRDYLTSKQGTSRYGAGK